MRNFKALVVAGTVLAFASPVFAKAHHDKTGKAHATEGKSTKKVETKTEEKKDDGAGNTVEKKTEHTDKTEHKDAPQN